MNQLIQSKNFTTFIVLAVALVCFGLAPMAQAVGPDTDGTIPGSNNGEGIGVLVSRTTGVWNTGTGFEALNHLTAGNQNTATGLRALFSDTNGGFNTATGVLSLFSNTSGFFNSATGAYSLANNISGNYNTANGYAALYRNTADANTATGFGALYLNTTGSLNTANGYLALNHNTFGAANTATGYRALDSNTTGTFNTAIGDQALSRNTTGFANTAIGDGAGLDQTTGAGNVYIDSGITGVAGESNVCYIASIFGQLSASGIPVLVNSSNKLGTTTSSKRFKEDIKSMDKASEAILALRPVSFRYKKQIDPAGTSQFGLVAEDVEKVNPELVVRDKEGKPYTVRYEAVNAMLLNEFLKAHRKIREQEATISQLKKGMEVFAATLKKQAAQIQKVSAQLEVSKAAPQMVLSNQ
jgi:hypothetical protein